MGIKISTELQTEFAKFQNPEVAHGQQAYMKSAMPYWGIKTPERKNICSEIFKKYTPISNNEYKNTVLELFDNASRREEWYASVAFALRFKKYIQFENINLYLYLVTQSQWWDVVDAVASNLIGPAMYNHPHLEQNLQKWIRDENMWIRRTALLTQLNYKSDTNFGLLTHLILQVSHEKEFFIRKAIGWVLREYSKINPEPVQLFIENNADSLSPLSVREGMKIINKQR